MQSGRRVGTHLTRGMRSAYNQRPSEGKTTHLCLLSKGLAGNQHAITMQSACNQHAISMQSACNHHAITMQSPCNHHAITMQTACNQHAISMQSACNQTHLCLLSEGLQQIIGAHASRCGDDRARPDHRGATAAAAAAIVPQLPLALIFETLRRCVHGACMHVVVGRPSVAISMHSVAISMHSVAISMHSVAISMHSVAKSAITCMHVVAGILFAPR